MTWVKKDTWVPYGMDEKTALMEHHPHVIFSPHRNHWLVRAEVDTEDPDYPILLKTLFSPLYGMRIRGYEFRHVDWEAMGVLERARFLAWEDTAISCRVMP